MKAALAVGLGTIVVAAAVIAAFSFRSGRDRKGLTDAEVAWVRDFNQWGSAKRPCAAIPTAPTASFRQIEQLARSACLGDVPWARVWSALQARFFSSRPLPTSADVLSKSHVDPRIGQLATRLAGRNVEARCWSEDDWLRVNVELSAIRPKQDYWVLAFAEPGRVQFKGDICQTLARFFGSTYTPSRNLDRAVLSQALVVLAHEAEHEYDNFSRSEAEVECIAVQHVRSLVRRAGRSKAFAADIAAYAWDVSYLRGDPVYGTGRCRNRGPLDLRPRSDVWP